MVIEFLKTKINVNSDDTETTTAMHKNLGDCSTSCNFTEKTNGNSINSETLKKMVSNLSGFHINFYFNMTLLCNNMIGKISGKGRILYGIVMLIKK